MKFVRWVVGVICVVLVGFFVLFVIGIELTKNKDLEAQRVAFTHRLLAIMTPIADDRARKVIAIRPLLGQAAHCGISQDEVLRLAVMTSAMVAEFSKSDANAEVASNNAVTLGLDLQKSGYGPSCAKVRDGLDALEQTLRAKGLNP